MFKQNIASYKLISRERIFEIETILENLSHSTTHTLILLVVARPTFFMSVGVETKANGVMCVHIVIMLLSSIDESKLEYNPFQTVSEDVLFNQSSYFVELYFTLIY